MYLQVCFLVFVKKSWLIWKCCLSFGFDIYFDVGKMESSEQWNMNAYIFNLDKASNDG